MDTYLKNSIYIAASIATIVTVGIGIAQIIDTLNPIIIEFNQPISLSNSELAYQSISELCSDVVVKYSVPVHNCIKTTIDAIAGPERDPKVYKDGFINAIKLHKNMPGWYTTWRDNLTRDPLLTTVTFGLILAGGYFINRFSKDPE